MAQTIAIDFDGVIHKYSKGWHDGTVYDSPIPGAKEAVADLKTRYAVAIFTTRDVYQVGDWLVDNGFGSVTSLWTPPFWNRQGTLLITNIKPAAEVYIDDRGLRFTSWDQAISDLEKLGIR